jgi:hypothetical protein
MNVPSLCETCAHVRPVVTPKGSRFLLCRLAAVDPAYPKYPPQPVVRCAGHTPAASLPDAEERSGRPQADPPTGDGRGG